MAEESSPEKLSPDRVLPTEPNSPPTPAPQAVQAAPAVVKRSMPIALSICLGILLAALAGWFFYYLTWFLLLLYLSFIAATILDAPVHWLKKRGLRRGMSAVLIMVGGLIFTFTLLFLLGTGIYNQSSAVSSNLERAPQRINDAVNGFKHHFMHGHSLAARPPTAPVAAPAAPPPAVADASPPATDPTTAPTPPTTAPGDFDLATFLSNAAPGVSALWTNALRGFEAASWLVIMFFIVLYMLVDGPDHLKAGRTLLPKHTRLGATKLFNEIARAHRGWALASLANVCSASILTGAGLYFLGVPGAFILGFFAGLGELIPNIGPFVGAMPAILLTLIAEPDKFFYVLGMFVVVQTVQAYTLSPQMLKYSIEMPVLVTIISVLVFGTFFGFLGILVAIPFVADMVVIWNYVSAWREKDPLDYDIINAPAEDRRTPASPDNTSPWRLRKLFRRERKHPPQAPPATGLEQLEKAEAHATPNPPPQNNRP